LKAIWRVPTPPLALWPQRNALSLSVVTNQGEWWRYELPSLTLRVRQVVQAPPQFQRWAVSADGVACFAQDGVAWQQQVSSAVRRQLTGLAGRVTSVQAVGDWLSLQTQTENLQRWSLVDVQGV